MALVNYGIARQVKPAVAITVLKLLVMPSLAYATSRLLGLPPIGVAALTLAASCPTGVNVFLLVDPPRHRRGAGVEHAGDLDRRGRIHGGAVADAVAVLDGLARPHRPEV